jgi:hypothetical protein
MALQPMRATKCWGTIDAQQGAHKVIWYDVTSSSSLLATPGTRPSRIKDRPDPQYQIEQT